MKAPAPEIARVSWDDFQRRLVWNQGEHVTVLGPTRSGKSTVALELLPRRRYVVVLATKPKDDMLRRKLRAGGYYIMREWAPPPPELAPKIALWPKIEKINQLRNQRRHFDAALNDIYTRGAYCIYVDELLYVSSREFLGLETEIRMLLTQGGSMRASVVGGSQRPAHIPLECYSQPRHLIFFRSSDIADIKRLRETGGVVDPKVLQAAIVALPRHHFLYLDTWTGTMMSSKVGMA